MIIASFQCQIMSAFFVPMKTNQIISLEIVFFITNFLVFVLLTIAIIIRINSKKEFSKAQYASFPFIVVSSALGIQLSRYFVGNKDKIIFVIAFILMSYIFSAISSLFSLDWYYMTLLEKTKKSEHKKTGDGQREMTGDGQRETKISEKEAITLTVPCLYDSGPVFFAVER